MDPELNQQAPERETSLNDDLSSTFDELSTADEGGTEVDSSAPPEGSTELPVDGSQVLQPDAVRDPALQQQPVYNEPAPQRWPAEIANVYNALPAAAKQAMMEGFYKPMQRQYTQATQELADARRTVEPLVQSLSQFRADFERAGIDPLTAFNRQMQWSARIAQVGPEQGIRELAKSYGVKLETLAVDPNQSQEYLTPFERSMKEKFEFFDNFIANSQQSAAQQAQERETQALNYRYAEVQSGLHEFINEQTQDGRPAHPHVEALAPLIAGLLRENKIPEVDNFGRPIPVPLRLEYAYNTALDIASKVGGAAPQSTNQRQVQRAKAARDVGVVTKIPSGKQEPADKSWGEEVEDVYDALARRVS